MKNALLVCGLLSTLFALTNNGHCLMTSAVPAEGVVARDRDALDEDDCPPQTIVSVPLTLNGNTTSSGWHFLSNCNGNGPDDIYALSLSCDYQVTVSLCGSGFDTVVEVHYGNNYFDCPGSVYIDCNDDFCGFQSQLSFFAAAGEFYFIVVSGYQGATGAYTLNVTGTPFAPGNDDCNGAILINNAPYEHFGSTVCANNSVTPGCAFSNAPDVVYRLNMPCNAYVTATTCGHPLMDAILHVYKYGFCGNDFVTCNDDAGCPNNQSAVNFVYEANQDYFIWVDGYSSNSGFYVLHVTAQGNPEDQCGVVIVDMPVTLNGTLVCEHNDYPQCFAGESNDDVFVLQALPECRIVTVSLCGTPGSWDSVLEIREGGDCPGATLISCTDDGTCNDVFSYHSTATFTVQPGIQYYFMVNGYFGSEGPYTMTVTDAPCTVAAPESLVVKYDAANGWIELSWAAVPGATAYNVYRDSLENVQPDLVNLIGSSVTTSFIDTEYPPNPCMRHYVVTADNTPWVNDLNSQPGKAVPAQSADVERRRALQEGVDYWPVQYDYAEKPGAK